MSLEIVPVTLKEAQRYIRTHHRHLGAPRGCLFCIGLERDGELVGVAVVGRPKARQLQDGRTAEVLRCCTDGTPNACSMLYGAAKRASQQIGYRRLFTYTLESELGTSVRAAGFGEPTRTRGGSWSRADRPREPGPEEGPKIRWLMRMGRG